MMTRTARHFVVCLVVLLLVAGCDDNTGAKNGRFHWLPFATDSEGQTVWLMLYMPSPVEFESYADCKMRIGVFLKDSSNYRGYKPPFGCGYAGDSYITVYLVNRLHDGSYFQCIARNILSPAETAAEFRYSPAILPAGQPRATKSWYCVESWV